MRYLSDNTYTTGEMLGVLKKFQKAEMIAPVRDVVVTMDEYGEVVVVQDGNSKKHIGTILQLTNLVMNASWKIEAIQVTFEDALNRLKEGKDVLCVCMENGVENVEYYSSTNDSVTFHEIIHGGWFIEN